MFFLIIKSNPTGSETQKWILLTPDELETIKGSAGNVSFDAVSWTDVINREPHMKKVVIYSEALTPEPGVEYISKATFRDEVMGNFGSPVYTGLYNIWYSGESYRNKMPTSVNMAWAVCAYSALGKQLLTG